MGKSIEWISVEERTPAPFVSVLLFLPDDLPMPVVHEGYYVREAGFRTILYGKASPTHWAAMPDPPEIPEELRP